MTSEVTNFELDINKIVSNIIDANADKILKKFSNYFKDKTKKFDIILKTAFTSYLIKSYNKYSKIKTLVYKTEPKFLYDFFECNTLKYRKKNINASDTNNIVEISKCLIITGTGGVGKSTLMKHIFIDQLKKDKLIPIYIELKDFNDCTTDFITFIYNSMNKLGFELSIEYFKYALECGLFIVLLDGYDEVFLNKSSELFKQIDELCDRYNNNHFIISSRPSEVFISFNRFTELNAQALTKTQAISLISKLDYDSNIKKQFIVKLKNELFQKHQSFASNPLLLNIMLLTYDNYAEIPEKLHIFYSNAFETLYSKHDATKAGYRREMKSGLPFDEFKSIFSEFAFITYIKGDLEFSKSKVYDYFKSIQKNYTFNIDDYLWDIEHSVCLIYLDGLNFRFTHRSFQEYFAAYFIKEIDDENQIKICKSLLSDQSRFVAFAVLEMLSDMSPERFKTNVLLPQLNQLQNEIENSPNKQKAAFNYLDINLVLFNKYRIKDIFGSKFDIKDDYYHILLKVTIHNEKYFIFEEARKYFNEISVKTIKHNKLEVHIDEIKRYLIDDFRFENKKDESEYITNSRIDITPSMAIKNDDFFQLIMQSWIGNRINVLLEMKPLIERKQALRMNDIYDFFKHEE